MTRQNTNKRLTCFYCKYEILNKNKTKHVKFKNKNKLVCERCTKKQHKPLDKKLYADSDVQCSSCQKPVMYKKCLECSICNHFIHGKCISLNYTEITAIEKVCNFYICPSCTDNTFPRNVDLQHNKNTTDKKKVTKQCLTCNNNITKQQYNNKNILYEGKQHNLCYTCSKQGINTPVKNKESLEFLDCSICHKIVNYESILCDLCQHWVHPQCNNINKYDLEKLNNIESHWYCLNCNNTIYPNMVLNIPTQKTAKTINKDFKTHDSCSVCTKKVTGQNTLSCSDCRHWVHKKCIGFFNNRIEYQSFLHYYSNKPWDCPTCRATKLPFVLLDNDEFFMLILENTTTPTFINKTNFQDIYLTLKNIDFLDNTDMTDDETNKSYLNDIDPDYNYKSNDTCKYLIDTSRITIKSNNELVVMTFNVRSIRKNFDSFTYLLNRINTKIHVLCLTETWLGPLDNIADFDLDGYHTPLFQNRIGNKHGGGVLTYVHKDIEKCKFNKQMSFADEFNHCLAVDITIDNKTTTFLNTYRSPSQYNNESFLSKLEETIEKAKNRKSFLLGDPNYNLIHMDKHKPTKDYYNLMVSSSFKQLITKPTRITETSKTLIDHIWTNDLRNTVTMESHIIITDITDHLPCLTIVKDTDINIKGYKYISKRNMTDTNREKFSNKITQIKDALSFHATNKYENDLDNKFNNYFDHIRRIYNNCFPIITKKVHSKTFSKPWITSEVQKLIKKKDKLYSKKLKDNTQLNRKKFKIAKKKMEDLKEKEKKSYYTKITHNESNNLKQQWNAIRTIINRKKVTSSTCTIPNNILGKHYSTVAEKLSSKLPNITHDDVPSTSTSYDKLNMKRKLNKGSDSLMFRDVTETEVYEGILNLDSNKGPGTDELDIKSLKSIANIIAPHLTKLFNESIKLGIYPQALKIAKCVPIYKGAPLDSELPVSYRPISILTGINKVFERMLHKQIANYLETNKLLPTFQYGYRKQHNTSQAILDFTDYIEKAMSKKLVTIAVFMDLSKAFDTVDVNIFKNKLIELGLSNSSISLIMSYMQCRKFCINNDSNHYYNLQYGVPQGSILGPLLFIMYTYDMINITDKNKVIVYADDTTVLITGKTLTEAKQHCNDILQRFYLYFTLNKLSINPSKTKYMLYKPNLRTHNINKKNLYDTTGTQITMDSTNIEHVRSIRFLGVIINDCLSWDLHKQHIHNKISKTTGLLYKCKEVMEEQGLIRMYKAFIQPYFNYAIEVWGHSVKSDTDMLVKLQSKVLRIVFNCKRSEDAWRHNKGQIDNITALYEKAITKLCFKHHIETLPLTFATNIMPQFNHCQLQNKITRISLNTMYDYKQIFGNSTLKISCTNIWNRQPLEYKSIPYCADKVMAQKHIRAILKNN